MAGLCFPPCEEEPGPRGVPSPGASRGISPCLVSRDKSTKDSFSAHGQIPASITRSWFTLGRRHLVSSGALYLGRSG